MARIVTYIRQLFVEDINLLVICSATVLTLFCGTIGIFYWGIDFYLLPLMLGLLLFALTTPLIMVLYLVRKNKAGQGINMLGKLKSIAYGVCLGLILLNPITQWDNGQRQKSGLMVSRALEQYKSNNGSYPPSLSEIKDQLTELPSTYSWDKYNYHLTDTSYDLDIPAAIMDIWHWDSEKSEFVYTD